MSKIEKQKRSVRVKGNKNNLFIVIGIIVLLVVIGIIYYFYSLGVPSLSPPGDTTSDCIDSDYNVNIFSGNPGKNYTVKGQTYDYFNAQLKEDKCYDTVKLKEFSCNKREQVESIDYICPLGCNDGACKVDETCKTLGNFCYKQINGRMVQYPLSYPDGGIEVDYIKYINPTNYFKDEEDSYFRVGFKQGIDMNIYDKNKDGKISAGEYLEFAKAVDSPGSWDNSKVVQYNGNYFLQGYSTELITYPGDSKPFYFSYLSIYWLIKNDFGGTSKSRSTYGDILISSKKSDKFETESELVNRELAPNGLITKYLSEPMYKDILVKD